MASRSVNKVILLGNLGRDAETRYTPAGVPVSRFTLATSRRWKDQQTGEWKEETDWHNIVLWRSENIAPHLQKGKQIFLEGRLQTRSWEDKDGNKRYTTEVVADNLILLGGFGARESAAPAEEEVAQAAAAAPAGNPAARPVQASPPAELPSQEISDDDVPF